jgi:IPT/TIG domain
VTALAADASALLIRSSPSSGIIVNIFTPPPAISSLSATSGVAGTQVTITGSGFGVWLGSTYATNIHWNDTQILAAPVASNSTRGTVRVQQGGTWSNAVPFTVNTATISNVVQESGVPGVTVVKITGSGFGAQGSGQVWLGSLNDVVQSWSGTHWAFGRRHHDCALRVYQ